MRLGFGTGLRDTRNKAVLMGLSPVTNLRVTSKTTNTINIAWDASENADYYSVERKLSTGTTWTILTSNTTTLSYADSGLAHNTSYDYRVTAINVDSSNPMILTVSTVDNSLTDGFWLDANGSRSYTEFEITWVTQSNADYYWVHYRVLGATTWTRFGGDYTAMDPTAMITGLSPETTYEVQVTAYNEDTSATSTIETQTTTAAPAAITPTGLYNDTGVDNYGENFHTDEQFMIRWTDTNVDDTYKLEYRVQGVASWFVGIDGQTVPYYWVSNGGSGMGGDGTHVILSDTTYEIRVSSFNSWEYSSPSEILLVQTYPSIPTTPTFGGGRTTASIFVTTQVLGDYTELEYRPVGGTFALVHTYNRGDSNTYLVGGLTPETTYEFRARSFNEEGTLGYSPIGTRSTAPNAPSSPVNLSASNIGKTTLTLSWVSGGGVVDTYTVEASLSGQNVWELKGSGITGTSLNVTGLTAETSYDFRVTAVNETGSSAPSAIYTATTLGIIYLRPTADNAVGDWVNPPLWSKMNDLTDTTFAESSNSNGSVATVTLATPTSTITSGSLKCTVRQGAGSSVPDFLMDLIIDGVTVASHVGNGGGTTWTTPVLTFNTTVGPSSVIEVTMTRNGGGNPNQRASIQIGELWIEA